MRRDSRSSRRTPLAWLRRCLAVVLLAAVSAAVVASAAQARTGPAGDAFYTPPTPLGGKRHGDVIWERAARGAARLGEARSTRLVLYRSRGIRGRAVAVSATVAIPAGRKPRGGWPVIAYAHGTTGIADACAPSKPLVAALADYPDPMLEGFLRRGWAVVRTDYEGLGTPGVHPYLIGRSEGRSVLDSVRAARRLDSRLSRTVAITGHSQGGHAALWAASLAPSYTPELRVRGTVAFAPASHIADQVRLFGSQLSEGGGLSALAALILRGIDTARPGVGVGAQLTPAAAALYPEVDALCLPQLSLPVSFGGLAPAGLVATPAGLAAIAAAVAPNDPDALRIRTSVRIEQGLADTTVLPALTTALVAGYAARGNPVSLRTYPGVTHIPVVAAARTDATRYLARRLR